jgi:hypothetical protein
MKKYTHLLRWLHARQELVVFRAERTRIVVDRRYFRDQIGRVVRLEADIVFAVSLSGDDQCSIVDVDLHFVGVELFGADGQICRAQF